MRGPRPSFAELSAGPAAPAGACTVVALEVTQVIQDPDHSVPLIAGKATIVRLYLDRPDPAPVRVTAEIEIAPSQGPPRRVPALNVLDLDPADNGNHTARRLRLDGSLNFRLPDTAVVAGDCTVSVVAVRLAATGEELAVGSAAPLVVRFVESPPLRVRLVSFRYQTGNPPRDHEPTARDHALIESWLRRAYPVPSVVLSRITAQGVTPWPNDATVVNVQLTAMRNADLAAGGDTLAHYYGLVADGGGFMRGLASAIPGQADSSAVASGPTGAKFFAWDTDGSYGDWYTGHELAHTFGRPHVGSGCGDIPKDNGYPFPAGQISGPDNRFVGMDVGDAALGLPIAVYQGTKYHDVMTYCSFIWMSAHSYGSIRQRLLDEVRAQAGPGPSAFAGLVAPPAAPGEAAGMRKWLNVVGTVNYTVRKGTIDVVQALTGERMPAGTDERARLQLVNDNGTVIGTFPARVKLETCRDEGDDETGIIDSFLPIDERAARVDLLIGQDTVASKRARAGAGPAGFAAPPPPSFTVQLSDDDGATWQTVAIGLPRPEYPVRRGDLPARPRLRIRFLVNEGFDTRLVREDILE